MSPIIKIFTGHYLDLDSVVAISDVYFINSAGMGGYAVGFDIFGKLPNIEGKESVFKWLRPLGDNECKYVPFEKEKVEPGSYHSGEDHIAIYDGPTIAWRVPAWNEKHHNFVCVYNLQKQVDVIISVWKQYKSEVKK